MPTLVTSLAQKTFCRSLKLIESWVASCSAALSARDLLSPSLCWSSSLREAPTPPKRMFLGFFFDSSILLTSALKRSSWARKAFSTVQTTLKLGWFSSTLSPSASAGTTTGMMIYPYFLPSLRRMTRPTDCTTSTCEFLGEMKTTASSDGTSTPSERLRALVSIRHSRSFSGCSLSHISSSSRLVADIEPSTWWATTSTIVARSSSRISSM